MSLPETSPYRRSSTAKALLVSLLVGFAFIGVATLDTFPHGIVTNSGLIERKVGSERKIDDVAAAALRLNLPRDETKGHVETRRRTTRCMPSPEPPPLQGKRGVGLTLRDQGKPGSWVENLPKLIALSPYWNYSWGPKRIDRQPENIEFIPMLWGAWGEEGLRRRIEEDIQPQIEAGQAVRLLGFNEPDSEVQSDMSVDEVVSYWSVLEETGLALATPAPVHAEKGWMVDFMRTAEEACLRMDYIAVHWYGPPSPNSFKNKMRQIYQKHGETRPLLVTEFSPADWNAKTPAENRYSTAQVLEFMKVVIPWMEEPEQDWIAGYAWFSFKQTEAAGTSSALFDVYGFPTMLARYYASVTNENPSGDQSIEIVA